MATSSKSYVKKVLVDEAELDRLQQRQIREYSPEIASLSRLKSDMDIILRHSGLTPQEKLNKLATVQGRFEKIRKDAGVLSSSVAAIAPPQVPTAPPPEGAKGDEEEEEEENAPKPESGPEDIPDPLSPTSKKVRHLGVKGQYERKARNVMLKINQHPEIIKANRDGELVVNDQPVPGSNFASLFRSVFSRTHDLQQPGINQFLGALRQIGVHSKELSGRAVQDVFGSPLPPRGDAAARLAAFRGRVPTDVPSSEREEEAERFVTHVALRPLLPPPAAATQYKSLMAQANEATAARKAASSSSSVSSPAAARSSSSGKTKQQVQEGHGGMQQPPGKRPNILYVY